MQTGRRVVIVGHPGALGMELLGVRDVLELANFIAAEVGEAPPYRVEVVTYDGRPMEMFGGLQLSGVGDLHAVRGPVDTLIVVGGPAAPEAAGIAELVQGIRRVSKRSGRVVGVCSGAFILAAAGLLDGRQVTTHWRMGRDLATCYPQVRVDTEPIYQHDDVVWTSAGITAGFDLMLALVERDAGSTLAREVARLLVVHLRRSGNQTQFSVQLAAQFAQRSAVRELQEYIAENPAADLSAPVLAERLHLSARHFARVFTTEVGVTPGKYVERVRLEAARGLLEEGRSGLESIATAVGFGNGQALRRAFLLAYGISPNEYRRRFGVPGLTMVG